MACMQLSGVDLTRLPYHSLLNELSQHDHYWSVGLPNHPPEISHCVLQGSLSGNERLLEVVALHREGTSGVNQPDNVCK